MLSVCIQVFRILGGKNMVTTPIRQKDEISLMKNYFLDKENYRDYALFVMGINSALRISDIIDVQWNEVYNFEQKKFKNHLIVREKKTRKNTCIALNENCRQALDLLMEHREQLQQDDYIFYSGDDARKHISRNRAWHIIKKAAEFNQLEGNISCHSLRKTFGYHAWKEGTPPALIMEIYNHSNIEITKRYLSIDQDEKDSLFYQLNL